MMHGTDEQQRALLGASPAARPSGVRASASRARGRTSPSLQTRAVVDGDDYIINGQKIWTSGAHRSQRMMLLARTDTEAPKHEGISYFLLNMKSPGITIRPLTNMPDTADL